VIALETVRPRRRDEYRHDQFTCQPASAATGAAPIIELRGVTKRFRTPKGGLYTAVRDQTLYVTALQNQKAIFSPDGMMPCDGPQTVLGIEQQIGKVQAGQNIDLTTTFTNTFTNTFASASP
jgi:hypothetical protein